MANNILITGITGFEYYPKFRVSKCCKQGMLSNCIFVPNEKPDIESINEIKVDMNIEEYKIIKSILGPKMLIYGFLNIQIIYVADNCQQSLHSAHCSIPFCDFVLIKDLTYDRCSNGICGAFVGIEDVCVKCCSRRSVDLSILYIICPKFYNNCCEIVDNNECGQPRNNCKKPINYREDYGYKFNVYNLNDENK